MATGNGGLHFEPTMDVNQIKKSAKEVKKEISDTTKAVEGMGTAFDLMTDITKQDIKDQKQYISGLEKEYAKLEGRIKSMPKGAARDLLKNKADTLRHEIESEKEALAAMEQSVERNSKAHQSFRTQLRQVNQEMMELAANGQKDSQAYRDLQARAVELQKNMGLVTKELTAMSSPTSGFQGVASGIAGVTGAFAAANGIIGLFGGSSENLNKIMARTQSLMAITMGLQQVANTLYEGSAFRVNILSKLKGLFASNTKKAAAAETEEAAALSAQATAEGVATTATTAATTAQVAETAAATTGTVATKGLAGAFKMLGAAIKKVPVFGWIIAGITALVAIVSHFVSEAREAAKAMDELRKKTAELAGQPVTAIELLSLKFTKLGDDMKAKEKFIEEYADKFKELGVDIHNVADAENLLIKNKDAFIQAQIEKARSLAANQMAQELMVQKLQLEQQLQATPKKIEDAPLSAPERTSLVDNPRYQYLEEEINKLDKKILNMFGISADAEANAANIMKESSINAWNDYAEGTVGAIEQAIAKKREALKNVTNLEDYNKIMGEIDALQKQLDKITGGGGGGNGRPEPQKNGVIDMIAVSERLDQKLAEMRALKEKVRKTGLIDQDELDKLEDEIEKLENLIERFRQLRDPGAIPKLEPIKVTQLEVKPDELEIKPREIEVMPQNAGPSWWKKRLNDFKKYFEELDYAEVADNFGEIASKIKDIGDAAGDADLSEFAEGLEEVSSLASTVIKGFQQGGWIAALISAIGWVATSLLEMAAQDAAVGKAIEDSYLATALKRINDMMQSFSESDKWGAFFGEDSIAEMEGALQALMRIKEDLFYLNKSNDLEDFANFKKGYQINAPTLDPSDRKMTYNDKATFWNWFGIDDQEASLTELAEMMGYSASELYKDGKYDVDILQQILDTYPKLAAEDREWIEAAIELTNQYNEALQQVADYMSSLFGQVADTIADNMIEAFVETGQAAIDFGEVVSDVAKKMAKDIIKNLMYAWTFSKLEDNIMKVIDEYNGLNADSAPIVLGMVQEALGKMNDQLPYYQQLLEALSPYFDGSAAEEAAASGNLLQSASQDSVSLLNGQLNAMRAYQGRMENMMIQVLWSLAGIRDEVNDFHGDSNRKLDQLIDNTSEGGSILHQLGIWIG